MKEMVWIILVVILLFVTIAWAIDEPEAPYDQEEDEEQEKYLSEWEEKHGRKKH